MRNIVITISRQYGSGGKTIGAMLAKELGINCYSRANPSFPLFRHRS